MKKIFLSLLILLTSTFSALPGTVLASNAAGQACAGLASLTTSNKCGSGQTSVNKVVTTVTKLISYIVGIVAVLVIIFAGFKYITSGGNNEAINSARNMIMYAIIGLALAVIAQLIVHSAVNTAYNSIK
jgi:Type IV secretion system pilin